PGAGFEVDTNIVTLVYRDGRHEALPPMPKRHVADAILDRLPWPRVRREADAGDRTGTEAGEPSREGARRGGRRGRGAAAAAPPMAKSRGSGGGTARGGAGS